MYMLHTVLFALETKECKLKCMCCVNEIRINLVEVEYSCFVLLNIFFNFIVTVGNVVSFTCSFAPVITVSICRFQNCSELLT